MKAKFTYKEFTLLAGIVVALIIMLTLWIRPVSAESGNVSKKLIPSVAKPAWPVGRPAAKAAVEKVIIAIQNSLY